MKYYLLIAGNNYYPEAYTGNWIGCFESEEEANSKVQYVSLYKNYIINKEQYDWYDIIDLRDWINKEND